ncbi:hypothetical protein LINPERHAP2_LOCUS3801, partial [Linum perenne]
HSDGKLHYLGGQTRVLSIDRPISFISLFRLLRYFTGRCSLTLRWQFPEDDLDDALVSTVSDEDLANLIEGYDRVSSMKILAFISILSNQSPPLLKCITIVDVCLHVSL